MNFTLFNSTQTVQVNSFGAQIMSWQSTIDGTTQSIFYTSDNPKRSGMPLMFPFCGPLADGILSASGKQLPQHGFARNVNWKVESQSETSLTLVLNYMDLETQWREAYPFQFELQFVVNLLDDGIVTRLEIHNWDMHNLPVSPGFHPYFNVKLEDKDDLNISNTRFDAKLLPWSTGVEAKFLPNPKYFVIQSKNFSLSCTDLSNIDSEERVCDLLTVWAGEVGDFVCIEPMSQRFNSINVNPILVPSAAVYNLEYNWKLN
jgi:galactose mutarotase-like enzyme